MRDGRTRERLVRSRWADRLRAQLGPISVHAILLVAVVISLAPILWSVSASFMGKKDLYARDPVLFPSRIALDNYAWTLRVTGGGGTVGRYPIWFKNSLIVSALTVSITLIVSTMAGYAFGRLRFRGRDAIFYVVTLLMFIPKSGGLMALFEQMYFLGLRNSLVGLSLLFAGGGGFMGAGMIVATFMMRQFFLQVPPDYEDAARVDGASRWQVFRHIMLPMATGAMAVVMILTFIAAWGEYLVTITMLDNPRDFTLAVGIAGTFAGGTLGPVEATSYGAQAAAYNMFVVPVVIVFLATQKWFIKGLAGGLKL